MNIKLFKVRYVVLAKNNNEKFYSLLYSSWFRFLAAWYVKRNINKYDIMEIREFEP